MKPKKIFLIALALVIFLPLALILAMVALYYAGIKLPLEFSSTIAALPFMAIVGFLAFLAVVGLVDWLQGKRFWDVERPLESLQHKAPMSLMAILIILVFFSALSLALAPEEGFAPEELAKRYLAVGVLFLIGTFAFSRAWARTDSVIFKIERGKLSFIREAVAGVPIQIYGKIMAPKYLVSPYTNSECVFYHSFKEKQVDSNYEIIENHHDYSPFEVRDKTGSLGIDLSSIYELFSAPMEPELLHEYTEIDALRALSRESHYETKEVADIVFPEIKRKIRKHYWRSEYVLPKEQNVFVYGMVTKKKGKKFITPSSSFPFILSRKTKEEYLEDFAKGSNFFYASNLLLAIGVTALYYGLNYFYPISVLFLALAFALIGFRLFYSVYNRFIVLRERANNSWSQINIKLKKRNDLVPALVESVKGYAKHEKRLFKEITQTRALLTKKISRKKMGETYLQNLEQTNKLMLVAEKYPRLRASKNFLKLQHSLADLEEGIAYARKFYNKSVLKYNTMRELMPFSLIAGLFGFKRLPYFGVEKI